MSRSLRKGGATSARSQRRTARFSSGPHAQWLLFGVAFVAAVIGYFIVDRPLFTDGRYGFAAIFGVVLAPLLAVILLYDPIAALLDGWLDRGARPTERDNP